MKIITKGQTHRGTRITCLACSCVFEIEDEVPIAVTHSSNIHGITGYSYRIDCPACGVENEWKRALTSNNKAQALNPT